MKPQNRSTCQCILIAANIHVYKAIIMFLFMIFLMNYAMGYTEGGDRQVAHVTSKGSHHLLYEGGSI